MNYEQKYKDALERARKVHNETEFDYEKGMMEEIFPELKDSKDEKIKKLLIRLFSSNNPNEKFDNISTQDIIAWLEKQGEQKERKFKVGDWVIDKQGLVHQVENVVENVTNHTFGYDIVGGGYFNDNSDVRLWTIEDAKDGDVLCIYEYDEPKIVFILKGTPKKYYALRYYCFYNIMYPRFKDDSEKGCLAPKEENVKPATKEQRDLLFQKMKEAGYEWDANKKELIKL